MFKHIHLDHVVLRAHDVQRLCEFYCAVLGCTIERELDIGLLQLRAGDIIIDIVAADSEIGRAGGPPPGPGRNLDHFCLRVEPFEDALIRAHLADCGVSASKTQQLYGADGYGPSIYVTDPEGNTMELKGPPTRGPET
jgi:glyoxylase I family protein